MATYDIRTGRPLHEGAEAVATLSDQDLHEELTIALLALEHRRERYEKLSDELLKRRAELINATR